jgi:hypothetical protein
MRMRRFALLLSLLALGGLGLVACDDNDKTATAETEVITSEFGADKSCGEYRGRGPGGYPVRIDVVDGKVPCRVAQRVVKKYYHGGYHYPWSCVGEGDRLMECWKRPGRPRIRARFYCRDWGRDQAECLSRFRAP